MRPKALPLPNTQEAALSAVAIVLARHLRADHAADKPDESACDPARDTDSRRLPDRGVPGPVPAGKETASFLIQVDGPGTSDFVTKVEDLLAPEQNRRGTTPSHLVTQVVNRLRGRNDKPNLTSLEQAWTVVRFDAWQYQRLAPPWWWLITAIDRQLHQQITSRRQRLLRRGRDYVWRMRQLLKEMLVVLPLIAVAVAAWYLSGRADMFEFGKWATAVVGGLTTAGVFLWSAATVVRRLLLASPMSASAAGRTSDPMRDLQRRYSYLIRSARTPVAVVIENLDRCRAEYVVELLQGIQTALKDPGTAAKPTKPVAFLVPASREWLCDSYRAVYTEFDQTTHEPGRPFGLAFLDKVFDVALQLPLVPAHASMLNPDDDYIDSLRQISQAGTEQCIRKHLAAAERGAERNGRKRPAPPVPLLRNAAVEQIGVLETDEEHRSCADTERAQGTRRCSPPAYFCHSSTTYRLLRTTHRAAARRT